MTQMIYVRKILGSRLVLLKWPMTPDEALKINKEELKWLLMGYEVRTKSKFKPIEVRNSF
ncbi:hypothetical protein CBEIBR21_07830 [Clostridium beijerinckii]|uniref:Uncharacterized protein n=1 Tax=Clostridium beijerinckii TaxID=1520 RepID=A0A1S9NA06_CLOBE|nr:hypothetical protein CBEIBR21_07830 [Clostridium beijerinckii]